MNEPLLSTSASRLATVLPVAIMVGIAILQLSLAVRGTLTPWKGGGYGMFASQDSTGSRFLIVRATLRTGEQAEVTIANRDLEMLGLPNNFLNELRAFPRENKLELLATSIAKATLIDQNTEELTARQQLAAISPRLASRIEMMRDPLIQTVTVADPRRPGHASARAVEFTQIEAAVWKRKFDLSRRSVVIDPFIGPVAALASHEE